MNLKSQISKFRSQILIGRYQSAIAMGKHILSQIQILMTLKILKDDRLQSTIQEQYQKCLTINSLLRQKIGGNEEQGVKKWQSKVGRESQVVQEGKWKKKNVVRTRQEETQAVNESEVVVKAKQAHGKQFMEFEQMIERQIMMRVKMPNFFKSQHHIFTTLSFPQQYYNTLLTYFLENGFTKIEYSTFLDEVNHKTEGNQPIFLNSNNCREIVVSGGGREVEAVEMREKVGKLGLNCVFLTISKNDCFQMM